MDVSLSVNWLVGSELHRQRSHHLRPERGTGAGALFGSSSRVAASTKPSPPW